MESIVYQTYRKKREKLKVVKCPECGKTNIKEAKTEELVGFNHKIAEKKYNSFYMYISCIRCMDCDWYELVVR